MKKIIVGALLATTIAATGIATPVKAQSISDLQALIAQLQAQIALLTEQTGNTSTGTASYYRDLTIGSTGSDVIELQNFLSSKGHLVIPAGVAKGYFGSITKSALVRYQASVGINPTSGYFGPLTRSHINGLGTVVTNPGNNNETPSNDELKGGEGTLSGLKVLGTPANEEIRENDSKDVFGFQVEAKKSDIRVERLDLLVQADSSSMDTKPWNYIDSATLMRDGKEIADIDLNSEKSWNREGRGSSYDIGGGSSIYTYRLRFSNVKDIIRDGKKAEYVIAFETKSKVDSDDVPQMFHIALDNNGVRGMDAEGIYQYAGSRTHSTSVTFVDSLSGDVDLSYDESENENRVVSVNEKNDTRDISLLTFNLESKSSDNVVNELTVNLATTTDSNSATKISNLAKTLYLYADGKKISTEAVGVNDTSITFENFDLEIEEDEEIEFEIRADIKKQEDNFQSGDGLIASLNTSGIKAEDKEGDDIVISGNTITGGEVSFRTEGLNVSFVSGSTQTPIGNNEAQAKFELKFKVTAFGDDVYVPFGATQGDSTTGSNGVSYQIVNANESAYIASTTAALTSDASISSGHYKVTKGQTKIFTLSVNLNNVGGSEDYFKAQLTRIGFKTGSISGTLKNFTAGLDEKFQTGVDFVDDENIAN